MKRLALLLILLSGEAHAGSILSLNLANASNMAFPVISSGVDTKLLHDVSVQAAFTGNPQGTLVVQGSNDDVVPGATSPSINVVNWADFPGTSASLPIINGTTSSYIYNLAGTGIRWIRLKYTPSNNVPQSCGGCVLTVNFFGKGD